MKTMLVEKEQFIVNSSGERVGVLLDLPTYERLCEAAEDNVDARDYRAAKQRVAAEVAKGECVTLETYRARRRKQK